MLQGGSPLYSEEYLLFIDILEDILEASIITLENGVFGTHVQRPLLLDGILET